MTTDSIPQFRVYIGSGGVSSPTMLALTRVLRANAIYVCKADDFVEDVVSAREVIRGAMVAVIIIGEHPLALVEGGVCLGVGIGCLWVKEESAKNHLVATPITANQALAALAEMKAGYDLEVAEVRKSAEKLAVGIDN